jgi:hypothetical protein
VTERVLITAELATARDEAERRARTIRRASTTGATGRLDAEIARCAATATCSGSSCSTSTAGS